MHIYNMSSSPSAAMPSMAKITDMLKSMGSSAPASATKTGGRRRRRSGTRKHRRGRGKKSRKNKWFF
jgi:hypothetical protein